jgi:hypothetical protein
MASNQMEAGWQAHACRRAQVQEPVKEGGAAASRAAKCRSARCWLFAHWASVRASARWVTLSARSAEARRSGGWSLGRSGQCTGDTQGRWVGSGQGQTDRRAISRVSAAAKKAASGWRGVVSRRSKPKERRGRESWTTVWSKGGRHGVLQGGSQADHGGVGLKEPECTDGRGGGLSTSSA